MHSREDEINESIEEQILLQNYFCEALQNAFSHFRRSNMIVQTGNSKSIKIAYGEDRPKTSTVCEIEELANATKRTEQLEKAYAEIAKAKFHDKHISLTLPKVSNAKYRLNNEEATITLSTALSDAALEREYFLEPQVLEQLNSRQRFLLCDLIHDQVATLLIPKSGGVIMEMYLSGDIRHQASQQAIGNVLSDCLKGNQLGMQHVGDYEPDKGFLQSLHNKAMCISLMNQLLEAKNAAERNHEDTKPYLLTIRECYKINQNESLQPHEKFGMMQSALIHAVNDVKSGQIKVRKPERRSSLPTKPTQPAESTNASEQRRHSEPHAYNHHNDSFTSRIKEIYDNSAKLVMRDMVTKPSSAPSTMFSLKKLDDEEKSTAKSKPEPPQSKIKK